jgi:peptidoglycan/LPS O-acetylase OafA/YrhL
MTSTVGEGRLDAQASGRFFSGARFSRPALTGLRALAAGWVVAFHLNGHAGPRRMYLDIGPWHVEVTEMLTEGWVGVDIFFVLSGFLLTLHFLERRAQLPEGLARHEYLWARLRRVVPAYWAQLALLFAFAWIVSGSVPPWTREIPAHLAFLQNVRAQSAINAVYWTLPLEFTFYLVLPFAAAWLARRGERPSLGRTGMLLVAAIACEVIWRATMLRIFGGRDVGIVFITAVAQLPGSISPFAWGMAAAAAFLALRERHVRPWHGDVAWLAALAGLIVWMWYLHVHVENMWAYGWLFHAWHPIAGALIAAMVVGLAAGGPASRLVFENRIVLWLGTISYSAYLWHPVIADRLAPAFAASGVLAYAAVAAPAIVAASALSYYATERPFLRRGLASAPGDGRGGRLQ